MPIRIDRIKVNRGGPLGSDFEFEPGDLNLIYGHNESGKTYVVEAMIKFLFRTSSRAPIAWNLREWDIAGRIVVSGLEDDPVSFTKTGRKLEDYWEEGPGLPKVLSRLLVVKAGETLLAQEEEDGVGRGILKNCLSGEGLLDNIASRISLTLKKTTVQDHLIGGAQMGEVKSRIECEKRRDSLSALLKNGEEDYASGEIYSLRQKTRAIEADLKKLEKAKRYQAAQLHARKQALLRKKDELPTEEELSQLDKQMSLHDIRKEEEQTKSEELQSLEDSTEDYMWATNAVSVYQEIMGGLGDSGPKLVFMFLALFFLVGAVVTGLLGLSIPLVLCAVGSGAFLILYYMETRKALTRAGDSIELKKLKAEFQNRFGSELTDKATLQAKLNKLQKDDIRATSLREEVAKLTLEINSHKHLVTESLKAWTDTELSQGEWQDTIKTLRSTIADLANQISSLAPKLASLNVPETDYLDKHPGTDWDSGRYDNLEDEREGTAKALDEETNQLELLKTRIVQETGSESTEWEHLITELRNMLEEAAENYREITAEILAKIQVNTAVQEFRETEDARIADGLKRDELTKPLQTFTAGRYSRIRQEEDSGLVLVTDEDEEYPLADMSTGAREQIYLALRMSFASIAMEGQTAFLVLDDAFQHSDWSRRKSLVTHTLSFVKNGWQVFYFSMDDHIRDLFLNAGEALGDSFKSLELC